MKSVYHMSIYVYMYSWRHLDVTIVTGQNGRMKVPITLNIEQTQLAVLKRWSQESGAPVSELIRRAISKALDEQNKREKKDKRN